MRKWKPVPRWITLALLAASAEASPSPARPASTAGPPGQSTLRTSISTGQNRYAIKPADPDIDDETPINRHDITNFHRRTFPEARRWPLIDSLGGHTSGNPRARCRLPFVTSHLGRSFTRTRFWSRTARCVASVEFPVAGGGCEEAECGGKLAPTFISEGQAAVAAEPCGGGVRPMAQQCQPSRVERSMPEQAMQSPTRFLAAGVTLSTGFSSHRRSEPLRWHQVHRSGWEGCSLIRPGGPG